MCRGRRQPQRLPFLQSGGRNREGYLAFATFCFFASSLLRYLRSIAPSCFSGSRNREGGGAGRTGGATCLTLLSIDDRYDNSY